VGQALADAVKDLRDAGIPLDAPLRGYQYELRGTEKIPIHGGPGGLGVFNAISAPWNGRGFPDVVHGSSFVMVAKPTGGCPEARTIVTYSQSENPQSPYYGDQTRMFSRKEWNEMRFCPEQVLSSRELRVSELGCLAGSGLRSVRTAAAGRRAVRLSFVPSVSLPAGVEVLRVASPSALLRRAVRVARGQRARRLDVRRLADGWYVARVSARAESGKLDLRELGFRVLGGRVSVLPAFARAAGCGPLRAASLGSPVFGSALRAGLRVSAPTRVAVEVLRGRRVVAGAIRTLAPGATRSVVVRTAGLARGRYTVRVRVVRGRALTTFAATHL
jgi:hypothetical protein